MSNRSYRRCKLFHFKACLDPSHMTGLDVDKVELVIDQGRIRLVLNERSVKISFRERKGLGNGGDNFFRIWRWLGRKFPRVLRLCRRCDFRRTCGSTFF